MATLSRLHADKLWDVCNWAHEVWVVRRELIDDNPQLTELQESRHASFVQMLGMVLHDYSLLQIAKLHDPAQMFGRDNLSLSFVVECFDWDLPTRAALLSKRAELDSLYSAIRGARHRSICHNDLETLLTDSAVGAFPADTDIRYFESLRGFVEVVYDSVAGGPCAGFSEFPSADAREALAALLVRERSGESDALGA